MSVEPVCLSPTSDSHIYIIYIHMSYHGATMHLCLHCHGLSARCAGTAGAAGSVAIVAGVSVPNISKERSQERTEDLKSKTMVKGSL